MPSAAAILNVDAYPLYWPEGWSRTSRPQRRSARYVTEFARARDELVRELKLMRAAEIVVSTNIPLRRDGLPYAGMAEPEDPGVAVYWATRSVREGKQHLASRVIACDHWRKVKDNLRAAGLAIESLRALERTGATQVVDKAFTGFTALAAQNPTRSWREVLDMHSTQGIGRDDIERRFRELARARHPDTGGDEAGFRELIEARNQALLAVAQ